MPETCGESIFHWKKHSKPWFQHLTTFSSILHQDLEFFQICVEISKSRAVYNEKAIKCCKITLNQFFGWNIDFPHVSGHFQPILRFDLFDLHDLILTSSSLFRPLMNVWYILIHSMISYKSGLTWGYMI